MCVRTATKVKRRSRFSRVPGCAAMGRFGRKRSEQMPRATTPAGSKPGSSAGSGSGSPAVSASGITPAQTGQS